MEVQLAGHLVLSEIQLQPSTPSFRQTAHYQKTSEVSCHCKCGLIAFMHEEMELESSLIIFKHIQFLTLTAATDVSPLAHSVFAAQRFQLTDDINNR